MNQIESNLLEAWQRVGERVKSNPGEALRRARRQFSRTLRRPMRAWCLAIRASDTRISSWNAIIEPPGPHHEQVRIDDDVDELIKRGLPHRVTLTGRTIRALTKPVHIPRPGVNWRDAADRCGVSRNLLRAWLKAGAIAIAYHDHPTAGKGWKPRPIVYTPSPLDPNHAAARAPDPLWGTMWQTHWQDLPEEFTQTLTRVPRTVTIRGRTQFAGWEWLCPGLPYFEFCTNLKSEEAAEHGETCASDSPSPSAGDDRFESQRSAEGEGRGEGEREGAISNQPTHIAQNQIPRKLVPWRAAVGNVGACGRRCSRLYAPLPMWTLGRALDLPLEIELPADSGLAGTWRPGEHFTPIGQGNRQFACYHCWRIHTLATANNQGWENYVSHISNGLLYGSEVERPMAEAPLRRKVREYRKPNRRAPKREAVLQLILQGQRYAQIAKTLRMTYRAVCVQAQLLFKIHSVHSREELIEQLKTREENRQIA